MKLFSSVLFAILAFTTLASAQDNTAQRESKKWMVTVQPVGYGPNSLSSTGINLGLFLDPESVVQVEFTSSSKATPFFTGSKDDYTINAYSIGVRYKQFVGNSFYFIS